MRETMQRTALAFVTLTTLALAQGAGAQQTTVTTNGYTEDSTSSDIDASCKEIASTGAGSVSAKCNKANTDPVSTTKDVSGNVGCGHSAGIHTAIHWGSDTTVHWSPKSDSFSVKLDSTGKTYLLSASCISSDGVMTANPTTVELGDSTNGLENDGGSLSF